MCACHIASGKRYGLTVNASLEARLTITFLLCKMSSCFDAICMHATQTVSRQARRQAALNCKIWKHGMQR